MFWATQALCSCGFSPKVQALYLIKHKLLILLAHFVGPLFGTDMLEAMTEEHIYFCIEFETDALHMND